MEEKIEDMIEAYYYGRREGKKENIMSINKSKNFSNIFPRLDTKEPTLKP